VGGPGNLEQALALIADDQRKQEKERKENRIIRRASIWFERACVQHIEILQESGARTVVPGAALQPDERLLGRLDDVSSVRRADYGR
jgi:hypothetical protein